MRKDLELHEPDSCWNRAGSREILFIVLARDPAAQATIQAWCEERIRQGKNIAEDAQILEALDCSCRMAEQRRAMARTAERRTETAIDRVVAMAKEALRKALEAAFPPQAEQPKNERPGMTEDMRELIRRNIIGQAITSWLYMLSSAPPLPKSDANLKGENKILAIERDVLEEL